MEQIRTTKKEFPQNDKVDMCLYYRGYVLSLAYKNSLLVIIS